MKIRNLSKGLLAMTATLLLGACGNTATDSAAGDEQITIEYWHPNADTQGGQTVTKLVDEFNASQDEVIVKAVYNDGMYQGLMQNLQTSVASGEQPALVQIGWSYREYFANNFAYTEPQEIIADYFPEDENYLNEKFESNILELAVSNEGTQVGLPYSLSVPVLHVNTEILEEAGVDIEDLTTWEAVREAANTIAEKTDYEGLYIAEHADNWNIQAMVESNGSQILKDGKAAFADEQGLATYQFYQDMVNEGSALHAPNDQGQQAFISGKVGMAHMTIAQRANIVKNASFEAAAVESPAFEGQDQRLPGGGSMLVVTAEDAEQQQAAYKFMKFLHEPNSVAAWTEGTGYVPETKDAEENETIQKLGEDPIFAAALSSVDALISWAPFPGNAGLEAEQLLIDLRDKVLNGADVDTTVKEVQDKINALIDKEA